MEQSQQKSEEMQVEKTNKEGLCIVHMKDSNLQILHLFLIQKTKMADLKG